jgi:hypothetical protein
VGVGCDTWMKNIGMDEDICIPINASMRMGIGISLGTGMGAIMDVSQFIHINLRRNYTAVWG